MHPSMLETLKRLLTMFKWTSIDQRVVLSEMLRKMTAGRSEAEDFYNARAVQITEHLLLK